MTTPPASRRAGRRLMAVLVLGAAGTAFAAVHGAPYATANVEVGYRDPAALGAQERGFGGRDDWLDELSRYVAKRAATRVPSGARLLVTITDVQLAGTVEPWRSRATDVRVVRDSTPPRIDLDYRLVAADGAVLKEGARRLRDLDFLERSRFGHRDEPLSYEKNLIDDWLRADFGDPPR